jgi:hypothetical protein
MLQPGGHACPSRHCHDDHVGIVSRANAAAIRDETHLRLYKECLGILAVIPVYFEKRFPPLDNFG